MTGSIRASLDRWPAVFACLDESSTPQLGLGRRGRRSWPSAVPAFTLTRSLTVPSVFRAHNGLRSSARTVWHPKRAGHLMLQDHMAKAPHLLDVDRVWSLRARSGREVAQDIDFSAECAATADDGAPVVFFRHDDGDMSARRSARSEDLLSGLLRRLSFFVHELRRRLLPISRFTRPRTLWVFCIRTSLRLRSPE